MRMEQSLTVVYRTDSYTVVSLTQQKQQFAVSAISIDEQKRYVTIDATAIQAKRSSVNVVVYFLGVRLQPASVTKGSSGSIHIRIILDAVLHIVLEKRAPASSAHIKHASTDNGSDVDLESTASARSILFMLTDIELLEDRRQQYAQRLWDIELEKEQQMRQLNEQKKRAVQEKGRIAPVIERNVVSVYRALRDLSLPSQQQQLDKLFEMLELPFVPMNSSTISSIYKDWLKLNRLAVLSLSDKPFSQRLTVESSRGKFKNQQIYNFSITYFEYVAGSRDFFVTQIEDEQQPSIGMLRKRLSKRGGSEVYGKLVRKEGIITDWLSEVSAAGDVDRSSLLLGTAYVLSKQLLKEFSEQSV